MQHGGTNKIEVNSTENVNILNSNPQMFKFPATKSLFENLISKKKLNHNKNLKMEDVKLYTLFDDAYKLFEQFDRREDPSNSPEFQVS